MEAVADRLEPAERFPDLTRAMIDAGALVVGGDAEDLHARVVAVNVWYAMERERLGGSPDDSLRHYRAELIGACREVCLSVGEDADEASKSKDATDYAAGYKDAAVDCDEALRELLERG